MDGAIAFLKGDSRDIIADLRAKMEKAAEELDFEQAAKLRDRINSIERIKEKQRLFINPSKSRMCLQPLILTAVCALLF